MIFAKMVEDPFYDDDGVLIDEDFDITELEDPVDFMSAIESFNPFETINS